jgi:hypothetical protein
MLKIISIFLLYLSLTNCSSFKFNQAMFTESNPDELAVETNKKLIIPSKFDLPTPVKTEETAADDNSLIETNSNLSEGEKIILEKTSIHKKNVDIKKDLNKKPNILKRIF